MVYILRRSLRLLLQDGRVLVAGGSNITGFTGNLPKQLTCRLCFGRMLLVTATFVTALAGAAVLVQGSPAARQVTVQESSFRPVVLQGEQEFAAEEYERAKRSFSKVIDGARSIPGAQTDLANALNDLAEVYREWQRPADARPLLEEALAITQATSDNKLQIAVLNNSGMVFQLEGRLGEAGNAFQRSLLKATHEYGRDSLIYARILDNIGQLRIAEGKLRQAERQFRESLRIRRQHADPNGPEVAESLSSIAGIYAWRGHYAQAELLYGQVLSATEKSLGANHLRTAAILANLGLLSEQQHRFDKAEYFLKKALEIQQAKLPPEHIDIARTLRHLGNTLQALNRYEEAATTLQRAVTISRKAYPPNDIRLGAALETYARALEKLNKESEAKPFLDEAVRIRAYWSYRSPSSFTPWNK